MSLTHASLRRDIVATARRMNAVIGNPGTSGNVSARAGTGFLVTPSGFPYEEMTPRDVVAMTFAGKATGRHAPSTEWPFHVAILSARPEVEAIVHLHSPAATALACLRRDLPPFHYMVAIAGGDSVRCAPYATFGTPDLAGHAVAALEGRTACLLANHGQIAVGPTLSRAFAIAAEIEHLCDVYLRACAAGEPTLLSAAAMAEALAKFATYGRKQPLPKTRRVRGG